MAVKLTQGELMDLHGKATSAIARARKALAKADTVVDRAATATMTGAAAFAAGVAKGRYGTVELAGVPGDLLGAAALHAIGFLGVAGKGTDYVHAAANGLLSSFASTAGIGIGAKWKDKVEQKSLGGGAGTPALTSGATVSDDELARLARGGVPA